MGLNHAEERWRALTDLLADRRSSAEAAKEYIRLLEGIELFLREANRSVLSWSRRMAEGPEGEAGRVRGEVEGYMQANRTKQVAKLRSPKTSVHFSRDDIFST